MTEISEIPHNENPWPPPGRGNVVTSRMGKHRNIGRNSPCPCGSGKKYKKCCSNKHRSRGKKILLLSLAFFALVGLVFFLIMYGI